ncbi:tautomerase family protein [Acinetobacter larvae]|uniref:5-carboxymethyl-2-hydroxymuconate isomerase n=1 Tax=Acinetobacter larvae TaxID=1789224 RepID=A0A1B2LW33_9GAMM|nr:hypothetical protein [Acinetobacter larvae]AOA57161.1 hypothetical protein BFG52_01535 [Acinetobacter larvae]
MPHLMISHSGNVRVEQPEALLLQANQALYQTGLFKTSQEIKSRIKTDAQAVIGLNEQDQAYIHAQFYILKGRDLAQQQQLAACLDQVLTAAQYHADSSVELQICTEIIEIEAQSYIKSLKTISA